MFNLPVYIQKFSRYKATSLLEPKWLEDKIENYTFNFRITLPEIEDNYIEYLVEAGDRIDLISYKMYGTPLLWWVIADCNSLIDPSELEIGSILKIPDVSIITEVLRTRE